MSDAIEYIDVDSDDFIDTPKALRDYVKKVQQSHKRLSEQFAQVQAQATASALTGVLGEFKNPERVKRDLLGDRVDPLDNEAVSKWLEANGDDYAKGSAAPAPVPQPVSDEERKAHERLNAGGELRSPADMTKVESVLQQITPEMTGADLKKLYATNGL